jgi:hypothetical protein
MCSHDENRQKKSLFPIAQATLLGCSQFKTLTFWFLLKKKCFCGNSFFTFFLEENVSGWQIAVQNIVQQDISHKAPKKTYPDILCAIGNKQFFSPLEMIHTALILEKSLFKALNCADNFPKGPIHSICVQRKQKSILPSSVSKNVLSSFVKIEFNVLMERNQCKQISWHQSSTLLQKNLLGLPCVLVILSHIWRFFKICTNVTGWSSGPGLNRYKHLFSYHLQMVICIP